MTRLDVVSRNNPFACSAEARHFSKLRRRVDLVCKARRYSATVLEVFENIFFAHVTKAAFFNANLMSVVVSVPEVVVDVVPIEFVSTTVVTDDLMIASSLDSSPPLARLRHVSFELFFQRVSERLSRCIVFRIKVTDVVEQRAVVVFSFRTARKQTFDDMLFYMIQIGDIST